MWWLITIEGTDEFGCAHRSEIYSVHATTRKSLGDMTRKLSFNPALLEEFAPVANGVVVEKQRSGDVPTAPSIVQQHKCVGPSRHPRDRQSIPRQRDQLCAILFAKEMASNHSPIRIRLSRKM